MADLNKPVMTDEFADVLTFIRENMAAIATLIDSRGAGASNLSTYAKRWNAASGLFQSWESSAWVDMTLSIAGGGTGATTAAAARAALGTNDANNITAGTLASARLPTVPVTKGGTGLTSLTSGSFLTGNGTGNVTLRTVAQVITDLGLGDAAFVGTSYFTLASHGAASSGVHGITGSVVGTDDVQTLTNKQYRLATGSVRDTNGNIVFDIGYSGTPVNYLKFISADSGSAAKLTAEGETNVDIEIEGKGTGKVRFPKGILGDWEVKAINTVYQAPSDGFVTGYSDHAGPADFSIFTDSAQPPTTRRTRTGVDMNYAGGGILVKKGDYWKAVSAGGTNYVFFISIRG